jgi:2-oxoglutarate ferredoxin oxidoreductase subunit delta
VNHSGSRPILDFGFWLFVVGKRTMMIKALPTPALNGGMLEPFQAIQKRTSVVIDHNLCTGCELCIHACPQSVLKAVPDVHRLEGLVAVVYNPALCTACRQCEDVCPDFCIIVAEGR